MSSTNKTTHYELSQYIGTDKPTYLSDYNGDMLKIDTGIHDAATDASTAVTTANSAASAASAASTAASTAVTTANAAETTANNAALTANTASTNAGAALTAAQAAQTAAAANTITNLAPPYDPTQTYEVDRLVTFIDEQGSGKLYKCIIAVDTPEAFNINKWDDVTASEAFEPKHNVIASVTTDGVKTRGEIITELLNNVDLSKYPTCQILQKEGSSYTHYPLTQNGEYHNAPFINFSSVRANLNVNSEISIVYTTIQIEEGSIKVAQMTSTDGTTGIHNDLTANVMAAGSVFSLIY